MRRNRHWLVVLLAALLVAGLDVSAAKKGGKGKAKGKGKAGVAAPQEFELVGTLKREGEGVGPFYLDPDLDQDGMETIWPVFLTGQKGGKSKGRGKNKKAAADEDVAGPAPEAGADEGVLSLATMNASTIGALEEMLDKKVRMKFTGTRVTRGETVFKITATKCHTIQLEPESSSRRSSSRRSSSRRSSSRRR